ncbi:G-protein coupled receptor 35-like [Heterodontus francisci]|uniref:G-protein coupled receptor 35-like n=1 Tax=Heterodontus francisci TaxID=7792 RepID=UPI00355C178E
MNLSCNYSRCLNSPICRDTATQSSKIFLTLLYCVITVLGLFFNVVALWIFQWHIRERSGTIVYMRNLAIADLMLVCFLPFRIFYYHQANNHSNIPCEIGLIIFLVNMYTSIFFLACISLDRCVAAMLPLKVRIWHLQQAAPWVSVLLWLLTMGSSLPPYLSWKLSGSGGRGCSCLEPVTLTNKLPLIFTLSIGFVLPFCLMLICSLLALLKVRSTKASGSQLLNARKIQNMILSSFLVFTICFLPYHLLLCLYNALQLRMHPLGQQLFQATQLLASMNAVLDPVVYYFTTEAFQKTHLMRTVRNMALCRCNNEDQAPAQTSGECRETFKKVTETTLFL